MSLPLAGLLDPLVDPAAGSCELAQVINAVEPAGLVEGRVSPISALLVSEPRVEPARMRRQEFSWVERVDGLPRFGSFGVVRPFLDRAPTDPDLFFELRT